MSDPTLAIVEQVCSEGGVLLLRGPVPGAASDLLRRLHTCYGAAQPAGFGPEWTPWGLITAILARSLPAAAISDPTLDPLAALGPRTAMALRRAELPPDAAAPEQVVLGLLALAESTLAPIALDRLERAPERTLRTLELLAAELPPSAALLLGCAAGPVGDRLDRLAHAVGGRVVDLLPEDAADSVYLLERRILALELVTSDTITVTLERLAATEGERAVAVACARIGRALRDVAAPDDLYELVVRRGLRLAAGLADERLATLLALLVPRFRPIPGPLEAAAPLPPDPVLVVLAARLGGLDLRAAAVDPFADLSRDDAVALAAEAAKSDGAPADRCRLFDTAARALLFRHAEHRAAERIFAEAEAEAEQGGLAYARVAALLGQATCRLARGDLDDAVAMREVADGLLPRLAPSDRSASVARVTFPGSVALYRGGDWRVLHNAATAALAAPHIAGSPAPGVVAAYDALFAVRSGDPSAARGRIAATLRIAAALGPRGYVADGIAGLAATASAELGDPAPAIDELLAAFQAAGCGGYVVVTLPLARARLATVIDPAAGAALLAAAGAEAERRELAGIAALARVEAALALHRAGDRDGARRTAADVAPALDRIGAPALVAAIAGLLDGVPRPTALPNGLSAREAEVLALLADGATSAEIAGRLVLSPHTVNRHVANAYAKAGLRNRAEAASYALRSGLVGSGRD